MDHEWKRSNDTAMPEPASGRPKGSVMTATFDIDGQEFVALNGGRVFTFHEAVSFQVHCQTWSALSAGGNRDSNNAAG
jgi:Uncharacterized protein conserved in bacteria